MKKYIIGGLISILMMVGMGALNKPETPGPGSSLMTYQQNYVDIATVTADATDLTVTTAYWDACRLTFTPIPANWNVVQLSFYGYGDGVGAGVPASTFNYSVYCCKLYGGAELITTGTATVASTDQQMSVNPVTGATLNSGSVSTDYVWIDTITESTKTWGGGINYDNNAGAQSIAALSFDRRSFYGIYVVITGMTSDSVTSITCVMNGY